MEQTLFTLKLTLAIGAGIIGGVFFAFSAFVMRALARLPAEQGIAAMQSINIVVLNPLFLGVFMGTTLLSAVAAVLTIVQWNRPGSAYLLAAAIFYAIGTFGITAACNVPLNNMLAPLSPTDPASVQQWTFYIARWTLWNHMRTIAAIAAVVCGMLSMR